MCVSIQYFAVFSGNRIEWSWVQYLSGIQTL